jgi:hypothetical protein
MVVAFGAGVPAHRHKVTRLNNEYFLRRLLASAPEPSTRGSRIAGVLFAEAELKPWSVGNTLPELWLNPWAPRPISAALPFATHTADDNGNMISTPADATPQQLFNLPVESSGNTDV